MSKNSGLYTQNNVMLTIARKHSQALEPEWKLVQESEGGERAVSVDCSAEPVLCYRSGVSSFPTIRLHRPDGKQSRYRGPRKATSILGFLRRAGHPVLSHIGSHNATEFRSSDDVVFIGYFSSSESHLRESFESLARRYHDRFSFALASSARRKEYTQSTVECHNNVDDMHRTTAELSGSASVEDFIELCSTPLIPEMTRRNELSFYEVGHYCRDTMRRWTDTGVKTRKSLVHYCVRNDKDREEYVAEMRPLARKYEEYLHFVTTDVHEYADAAEMMGLQRGATGLSVQNPNTGDVFPYTRKERISAGTVEAFLIDIIQGKVPPWKPDGARHDEL